MAKPTPALLRNVRLFSDLDETRPREPRRRVQRAAILRRRQGHARGRGRPHVLRRRERRAVRRGQHGESVSTLGPGSSFGEIALIDRRPRTATVTAVSDVTAYGLPVFVFRPFVESRPQVAWKMLESMARPPRVAESRAGTWRGRASARAPRGRPRARAGSPERRIVSTPANSSTTRPPKTTQRTAEARAALRHDPGGLALGSRPVDLTFARDDELAALELRVESDEIEHRRRAGNEIGAERRERGAETSSRTRAGKRGVGRELGDGGEPALETTTSCGDAPFCGPNSRAASASSVRTSQRTVVGVGSRGGPPAAPLRRPLSRSRQARRAGPGRPPAAPRARALRDPGWRRRADPARSPPAAAARSRRPPRPPRGRPGAPASAPTRAARAGRTRSRRARRRRAPSAARPPFPRRRPRSAARPSRRQRRALPGERRRGRPGREDALEASGAQQRPHGLPRARSRDRAPRRARGPPRPRSRDDFSSSSIRRSIANEMPSRASASRPRPTPTRHLDGLQRSPYANPCAYGTP